MRVLVTGSEGFVGRHFVRRLHGDGAAVTEVDLKTGTDCRDTFQATTRGFDLVIHCAAIVGGRETIDGNPLAVAENLSLDEALFRWAVKARPGRVVYFSSSAAYPTHLQTGRPPFRLDEDAIDLEWPQCPDQTYGWAKLTGERLAGLARSQGVPVTIVRPFSGYGTDQDPTYPFPAFIERAKAQEDPFVLWGDGQQVRDFIHIDDIVDAVLHYVNLGLCGPFNLGTSVPTSMEQLATAICREVGYEPTFKPLSDKPSGVQWRVACTRRMRRYFKPQVTLAEGIKRALR